MSFNKSQRGKPLIRWFLRFVYAIFHLILAILILGFIVRSSPTLQALYLYGSLFTYSISESPPPKRKVAIPTEPDAVGGLCLPLNGRTLDIPKSYLTGAKVTNVAQTFDSAVKYNPFRISKILALGEHNKRVRVRMSSEDFLKHYPAAEEKMISDQYGERIHIEWLDESVKARYLDPDMHIYSDAWYGVNTLKNPKVSYLDKWNIYRVHQVTAIDAYIRWPEKTMPDIDEAIPSLFPHYPHLPEFPHFPIIPWTALKTEPRSLAEIPNDPFDFWLANCQFDQMDRRSNCQSWLIDEFLLVEFDIKDVNLDKIDAIKQTIKAHLNEWSRPCTPSYLSVEQSEKPIHPDATKSVP